MPLLKILPSLWILPVAEIIPLTFKLVSVPMLVIFGCAFVVTVPATLAFATVPLTLAPLTLYAVVAILAVATVPLTFAPLMLDKFPASPVKLPAITLPVVTISPVTGVFATTIALLPKNRSLPFVEILVVPI